MKKKAIVFILIALLGVAGVFCACSDDSAKANYKDEYSAVYGTWFVLPEAKESAVTDSEGNSVAIECNRFFVADTSGYTLHLKNGKKVHTANVKVTANTAPFVSISANRLYGSVGTEVELPQVYASDGVREISADVKVFFGDVECDITSGFIPAVTGTYTLRCSAEAHGYETVKTADIYIEKSSEDYEDKLSSFDKPYGVHQLGYKRFALGYDQKVKYADEEGSLRVSLMPLDGFYEFSLSNLDICDVREYDAIYWNVYNPYECRLSLYVNYAKRMALMPKMWTRVYVQKSEYQRVLTAGGGRITLDDINGVSLYFIPESPATDALPSDASIYFSAMRGLRMPSVADIDELCGKGNKTQKEFDDALMYCNLLKDDQINELGNYDDFMTESGMYFAEAAQIPSEQAESGRIIHFDKSECANQFESLWGIKRIRTTDKMLYNGENTLQIINAVNSDFAVKLSNPYVYDLSAYDYLELNVYVKGNKKMRLYNYANANGGTALGIDGEYDVEPGKWNKIILPLSEKKNIKNARIWFIDPIDWGISSSTEFYLSAIDAKKVNVDLLNDAVSSDDVSYISTAMNLCTAKGLSNDPQYSTAYKQLVKKYFDACGLKDIKDGRIFYFDQEAGTLQMQVRWGTVSIEVSSDMQYKGENTLKIVNNGTSDIALKMTQPYIEDLSDYDYIELNVYVKSDKNVLLYSSENGYELFGVSKDYVLECNKWNTLRIEIGDKTRVEDTILWFMDFKDGGMSWSLGSGVEIYIAPIDAKHNE